MRGKKWQKIVGGAMAGLMSFSIMGTTLIVPAHAASWNDQHWHDVHQEMQRHQQSRNQIDAQIRAEEYRHNERVRQLRQEREKRWQEQYDRERREHWAHEHGYNHSYESYRQAKEREAAAEAQRKHDQKVRNNRAIAAVGVGAVIAAVIASHNKKADSNSNKK